MMIKPSPMSPKIDLRRLCAVHIKNQFTGKKIRLVGGRSSNEGRVEVYHDGQWGTVCDDGFGNTEAEVVCRLLGYSPNKARVYRHGWGNLAYGRIWLDDLRCTGNESSIFDCPHRDLGVHDCGHGGDVGVNCYNGTAIPDHCSPNPCQSGGTCVRKLRINYENTDYKCICPYDRMGVNCEKSYDPCASYPCHYGGTCIRTNSTFWPYSAYRCNCAFNRTGEMCEYSIGDSCSSNPCYNGSKCVAQGNDYACACPWGRYGKRCESNEFPVRLVGGRSSREGRVEVYFEPHGSWGTVCDDGFDDNAARVICRSLGFG
ncbi:neurotrypsin [Lingula anatina]|uniref:Neurotrypsin n=1 Tax=Lingula anatina TaxID=7574 RepID=A0A2R2MIF1_LINAN|nr:neurotrypsin [Lingula anatina]|eukprot:XP_023929988.1 neurotrypsin [Lingula anatina]